MKIGLAIHNLPDPRRYVGSKRIFLSLAEGLARKGHDVTVFANEPNAGLPRSVRFRGYVIQYVREYPILRRLAGGRTSRNLDPYYTVGLGQETLFNRQDALISVNDIRPFLARNVGRRTLALHILPPYFSPPKNPNVQRILKADVAICCSGFVAETASRLFPNISSKYGFVHNGIDCDLFSRGEGEKIRAKLSIPPDHTVVLYAGEIIESKGLAPLVRAFKKLNKTNPKTSLLIVGSTDIWRIDDRLMRARLSKFQEDLLRESTGLPVHFVGKKPHDEMPDYYAAADIFVNPSTLQETFSLVNLEAMASGKPVVSSRVGGIPEVVRDNQTGYLVPPSDSEALFEKLELLARNPDLRKSMGEAGRRLAETSFSLDRMVDGYLSELTKEV